MQYRKLNRLRKNSLKRNIVAETNLNKKDLILPLFITEGENLKEPISSMPGVYHFSIDKVIEEIKEVKERGINSILLFGVIEKKNNRGSYAYKDEGLIQRAVENIKKKIKNITIFTDVCLCGYTSHGHCGIIKANSSKLKAQREIVEIDEEKTLETLAKIAVSHAKAGADFVAPSAMMEGQVGYIRKILDNNGFTNTGILGYSAKYASNFYSPFRDALESSPEFGDRKSYQMDFRNSNEALREIKQDKEEGADIVMVKPALSYLDIIYMINQEFNIPLAAYNVSGEYSMVKAYCQKPVTSNQKPEVEKNLVLEILTSIKRAGADLIITYFGKEIARYL